MSPIISTGNRVLCSIIRIISGTGSPRERSLTVRNWMPSWKMSVANFDSEPIVAAADVDPVHHHHHEADQHLPLRRVDRRVHGDVVEMLADRAGVVGDDDVALVQVLRAVEREPVLDRGAHHVGDEHRHARGALADQVAVPHRRCRPHSPCTRRCTG